MYPFSFDTHPHISFPVHHHYFAACIAVSLDKDLISYLSLCFSLLFCKVMLDEDAMAVDGEFLVTLHAQGLVVYLFCPHDISFLLSLSHKYPFFLSLSLSTFDPSSFLSFALSFPASVALCFYFSLSLSLPTYPRLYFSIFFLSVRRSLSPLCVNESICPPLLQCPPFVLSSVSPFHFISLPFYFTGTLLPIFYNHLLLASTNGIIENDFLFSCFNHDHFLRFFYSEQLLTEVHKECAYEAEKAEKLRNKITNHLMNGIIVKEMPLYGFNMSNQGSKVCNLRMVKSLRTQVCK